MEKSLELYLDEVDKHLKPISTSERVDIIKEIKSYMIELEANEGLKPEDILSKLDDPKELAKGYLSDYINNNPKSGWQNFAAVAAFYSLTGFTGMFILPIASVLAVGLMFSGAIAPIAGIIKLGCYLFGIDVPFINFHFGSYQLHPIPAFFAAIVMGILLFAGGKGCWKLTLGYIRSVSKKYHNLVK